MSGASAGPVPRRGPELRTGLWAAMLYDGRTWRPRQRVTVTPSGHVATVEEAEPASEDLCVGTLVPGFVNAHVHLELGPHEGPRAPFTSWLRSVIEARFGAEAQEPLALARAHLARALAAGYTSFCEVDSTSAGERALAERALLARCDLEVIGFDLDEAAAEQAVATRLRAAPASLVCGLSPHAPYSVGAPLFGAVARSGLAHSVHVAETPEELEFLRSGTGPFATLLEERGRLAPGWKAPGLPPIAYLDALGLLGPNTLLVHAQHATPEELQLAAARGAAVAICPGTIEYFDREPVPLESMLGMGLRVGFGTDSLASTAALDPRRQLRMAERLWPELPATRLLSLAGAEAAAALRLPAGRILPGRRFDAVALAETAPARNGAEHAARWLLASTESPAAVWLAGTTLG